MRRRRRNHVGSDGVRAVGMENHIDGAEAQWLAALEACLRDFRAVDVSSIGGTHVFDGGRTIFDDDLAMGAGDAAVFDFEVVAGSSA